MPLPSYRVYSPVWIGPPPSYRVAAKKVDSKDIKSMIFEPPTVGSYGHGDTTQIFTKNEVVTRTSSNRFVDPYRDFARNGFFSQVDDYYFGHWIKAGEDVRPNMFSPIPKMEDFALIEGPSLGMYFPDKGDTAVALRTKHDTVNAVNPNMLGYFHSKLENFNFDLRNLMFDPSNKLNYEATEWIKFLSEKGISVDTSNTPGIIGLGIEKGDFTAAYYPRSGYLIREDNFEGKSKSFISRYGLSDKESVEAMKRSVLLHEFAHSLGVGGSDANENLQGRLQAEFYSKMAEKFKGTRKERIYRALAQEGKDYANQYLFSLEDLFETEHNEPNPAIRQIERKFIKEAQALELDADSAGEYVRSRMIETFGNIIGGEPSYRPKARSKAKKNSRSKESLDDIVNEAADESSRVSFMITEEGTLAPTYEKRRVYDEGASMPTKFIGKKPTEYQEENAETYEGRVGKTEYKSMKDVKEKEEKAPKESEAVASD